MGGEGMGMSVSDEGEYVGKGIGKIEGEVRMCV